MENSENLTSILQLLLIVSITIFFILFVALIFLTMKKKQKEKEASKTQIKDASEEKKASSNLIQTRVYTPQNVKNFLEFD